jgi:3-oxoacyl-[acyl-carrier-protein] synthase-3
MQHIKIVSTGLYLPPKIQTAKELSPLIGRSEQWIIKRTGVAERRIAEEPMDKMAAKAARQALGDEPPDCIINASATPLQLIPDSAPFIQRALGLEGIPAWSIHGTCLSFVIALNTAAALITAKSFKRILIVSSEAGTPFRDFDQPESASLFGDGAAAAVVEATPENEPSAFVDWEMNTWPEGAEFTEFRGAGTKHPPNHPTKTHPKDNLFQMHGTRIYRMARDKIKTNLTDLFDRNDVTPDDIDWLIMHQASGKAVEMAAQYGFPPEKTVNIIGKVGNTIAASTPMVLATADKQGLLKRGDLLLLGGTGAGLSVAFALVRW